MDSSKFKFILHGASRSIDAKFLEYLGFEVECYEQLPYRVFINLYNKIHFLLVLSYFEGGPASIPEAFASSTPIVGTNVGFIKDCVIDEINGVILENKNDEDNKSKFTKLYDTDFANSIFRNVHDSNNPFKDWSLVIQEYEKVYSNFYY